MCGGGGASRGGVVSTDRSMCGRFESLGCWGEAGSSVGPYDNAGKDAGGSGDLRGIEYDTWGEAQKTGEARIVFFENRYLFVRIWSEWVQPLADVCRRAKRSLGSCCRRR